MREDHDIALLDAPVSGGVKRATDGSLAIMVGGDAAILEQVQPILRCLGNRIVHVGPVGCGHAAKALNNFVSAAGLVAAVEALHTARKFGMDSEVMTAVLNASTGRNNTTENKVAQFMLNGRFDSGFALALMAKDLRIALDLAASVQQPARLAGLCAEMWEQAAAESQPGTDHTQMYTILDC